MRWAGTTDRSQAKLIWSLKNDIFVSECSEDMCLLRNKCNLYLGDDRVKESVIICDHVHFSCKDEWTQDYSNLLKGRAMAKNHVTLIQEMNIQWDVLLSINRLCSGLTDDISNIKAQLALVCWLHPPLAVAAVTSANWCSGLTPYFPNSHESLLGVL